MLFYTQRHQRPQRTILRPNNTRHRSCRTNPLHWRKHRRSKRLPTYSRESDRRERGVQHNAWAHNGLSNHYPVARPSHHGKRWRTDQLEGRGWSHLPFQWKPIRSRAVYPGHQDIQLHIPPRASQHVRRHSSPPIIQQGSRAISAIHANRRRTDWNGSCLSVQGVLRCWKRWHFAS